MICTFDHFLEGKWDSADFQHAENFLPFRGELWTSEKGFNFLVAFPKPADIWDAACIFHYLKSEVAGFLAQVIFGSGEDALMLMQRILRHDEAHTGGSDDADRPGAAIQCILRSSLIQVAYD